MVVRASWQNSELGKAATRGCRAVKVKVVPPAWLMASLEDLTPVEGKGSCLVLGFAIAFKRVCRS